MRKLLCSLVAICCAFCLTVRAEDAETKAADKKAEVEAAKKAEKDARNFEIEKDGKIDAAEWSAAVKIEEKLVEAEKEKDSKRAELWRPALKGLGEKLGEKYKDAKTEKKEVHAALTSVKDNHPMLWERLVEHVKASRAKAAPAK